MTRSSPASVTIFNCLSPSLKFEMSSAPSQTVFGFGIHIRAPYYSSMWRDRKTKKRKDEGMEQNTNKYEIQEHLISMFQMH